MLILDLIGGLYLIISIIFIFYITIWLQNFKFKNLTWLQLIIAIVFLPSILVIAVIVFVGISIDFILELKIWDKLNVKIFKEKEI